jgi:hypothetical protein
MIGGLALSFSCIAPLAAPRAATISAKDAMARNEDARRIDDVTSEASLKTGGGTGAEKLKTFTWFRKLAADKVRFNTLTRFKTPAEIRGEGILFLEKENDQSDVQMYLPAFKKIRRVESQAQSGSFMGSELSYADIATPHLEDSKYTARPDADCGDPSIKVPCLVVESTPATDAVRERTGYSKTVQWLRPDCFMAVRAEFYDLEGQLIKKLQASRITEVDPTRHKWMAEKLRIDNVKTGKFTELEFSQIKVNTGLADSTFTPQNLMRER